MTFDTPSLGISNVPHFHKHAVHGYGTAPFHAPGTTCLKGCGTLPMPRPDVDVERSLAIENPHLHDVVQGRELSRGLTYMCVCVRMHEKQDEQDQASRHGCGRHVEWLPPFHC